MLFISNRNIYTATSEIHCFHLSLYIVGSQPTIIQQSFKALRHYMLVHLILLSTLVALTSIQHRFLHFQYIIAFYVFMFLED